ncbi:MAG TPA: TIGR02266 family protein [Polyangia bacterium]|nr:TIGR02266 family protein [Polyangia bacterium]
MSRSYVRASERTDLEVKVDFAVNDMTYTGVTRNISAGGVFVATALLPKVGERINLKFSLPGNGRELSVQTEVRWVRKQAPSPADDSPSGMGLQFVNPSADDVAALEEFLARRDALMGDDD